MICRDMCPDNHVTKVPFLVAEIVTPLRPSIPDIGRRGTMTMPGLSAESSLYRTSEYYHTVGTFTGTGSGLYPAQPLTLPTPTCLSTCLGGCLRRCVPIEDPMIPLPIDNPNCLRRCFLTCTDVCAPSDL